MYTSLSGFVFTGALTDMPAVRVFSLYSAMAVLLDFLFQITVFVAIMTLDAKREEVNRNQIMSFCLSSMISIRCIGQWLVLLGMGCVICNWIPCLCSPVYFVKHTLVLALTAWFWFFRATDWTSAAVCSWTRQRKAGPGRRASCSRSLRTSTRRRCYRAWSGPWW